MVTSGDIEEETGSSTSGATDGDIVSGVGEVGNGTRVGPLGSTGTTSVGDPGEAAGGIVVGKDVRICWTVGRFEVNFFDGAINDF